MNFIRRMTAGRGSERCSERTILSRSASTISALPSMTRRNARRNGTIVSGSNDAFSARQPTITRTSIRPAETPASNGSGSGRKQERTTPRSAATPGAELMSPIEASDWRYPVQETSDRDQRSPASRIEAGEPAIGAGWPAESAPPVDRGVVEVRVVHAKASGQRQREGDVSDLFQPVP